MRGYTSNSDAEKSSATVSPVHAGIYPYLFEKTAVFFRFPRSCGDIPGDDENGRKWTAFPPFMRGYTCGRSLVLGGDQVSPVHAGIYPQAQETEKWRSSFPRSCGDIPSGPAQSSHGARFPPFMRGYTRGVRSDSLRFCVSPVHAGIYHNLFAPFLARISFPRSCGDIPSECWDSPTLSVFPPFMRGYTRSKRLTDFSAQVSPVHAGIYLFPMPSASVSACFPRSCGDIPAERAAYRDGFRFPPFMRGYTCGARYEKAARQVSPVHAGIYPAWLIRWTGLRRFPRSCGDIPFTLLAESKLFMFPPFMRGYT